MHSRIFRKYALLFAGVVIGALVISGLLDILYSYREQMDLILRLQREQARSASQSIGRFLKEAETQVAWTLRMRDYSMAPEDRRVDALRVLRQAPAITEIAILDFSGREHVKVSRHAPDFVGRLRDRSEDAGFDGTLARKRYYGPVYFRYGSEPYITLGLAGERDAAGVVLAEVNLRFMWDALAQIRVGQTGRVFVTDSRGVLIAHPDVSLVLSNKNVSNALHVAAALSGTDTTPVEHSLDLDGGRVLTSSAGIEGPGWTVFVELPYAEAYAPIYASLLRSAILIALATVAALIAGFVLARKMTGPIATLSQAAANIGRGDLTQRVAVHTGDELETLADNLNLMARRLRESYATLEQRIGERTQQLAAANAARSRFLAIASHDLRQPLHALGLFIGQLRRPGRDAENAIERAESALGVMHALFDALLDISKLDTGGVKSQPTDFPVQKIFERLLAAFGTQAKSKNLSLRVVPSNLWVRSDPILLERILNNLVSNAVRYTQSGSIVVGCRRRAGSATIEVHDSGPGIPEAEQENVFREFVRLGAQSSPDIHGLGLGLAVVERLSKILRHDLHVRSAENRGSCFGVTVQIAAKGATPRASVPHAATQFDRQLIAVIDDDQMTREAMSGLLAGWGCRVAASSLWHELATSEDRPQLIIADYDLGQSETGAQAIAGLRARYGAEISAVLISGDTTGEAAAEASDKGFTLLRKPVAPMALRAVLLKLLRGDG